MDSLERVERYERWAESYDEDGLKQGYNGPKLLAQIVTNYVKDKKNSRILELCAGTGATAAILRSLGYVHIDGHDGSKNMLRVAKERKIYENLYEEILQPGSVSVTLPQSYYDALIGVGLFSPTLMNADYMDHLLRPVKKNGFIIFGLMADFLEQLNKDSILEHLETTGVWCYIDKIVKNDYLNQKPGVFFIYRKM